jgi:hypothetical protein
MAVENRKQRLRRLDLTSCLDEIFEEHDLEGSAFDWSYAARLAKDFFRSLAPE